MTRRVAGTLCAWLVVACATTAAFAQDPPAPVPLPILKRLVIEQASVFTPEDLAWLLHLRTGARLPAAPDEIAARVRRLYEKEGYTAVRIAARFDESSGTLTLTVTEPRFDELQFRGASAALERRIRDELARSEIREGQPFNATAIARAVRRAIAVTHGAFSLGDIDLLEVNGRQVAVIPVRRRDGEFDVTTGSDGREDLYSPVDGLAPALGFTGVAYDPSGFNYTLVNGFVSWKLGRGDAGYSLGVERPLLADTRLFVGTELHDLTASDDGWRIGAAEQMLAGLLVKRTFRDYYRRRGMQVFGGFRPSRQQEVMAAVRWDRHEPLENEVDFSLFRRGAEFRTNPAVSDAELNAVLLAYTFDTRGLDRQNLRQRYVQHLTDDLFRGSRRRGAGFRLDWTSEIAGRGLGGDYDFTRHILNARTVLPAGPHQTVAARAVLGWSDGMLPIEREFAVGGLGTVRGHAFKRAAGAGMTLVNAEYAFDLEGGRPEHPGSVRLLLMFDAGKVRDPNRGSDAWMKGVGFGVQTGPLRFEWAFDPSRGPGSGEFYVRLGRGF